MLDEPSARRGPAIARLEHVVRRMVHVLAEHQPYVTLLLRVRGNTPTEQAALGRRREFDRIVSALVAKAAREGDVRTDVHPDTVTRLLFGMVNSLVEWYRPEGGDASVEGLADAVVGLAFSGLRTDRRSR